MAHSMSTQKVCDLCETDNIINCKCINCNLLMCSKCKEKVHSKIKYAEKHKIIDMSEVEKHFNELDFRNIYCEDHKGQTCFMFCESCELLVCSLCIAEVHNGHGLVQISEGFNMQVNNVKIIQDQIELNLKALTRGETKIKLLRKHEHSKYIKARNLIETQNTELKREVDKYTEKLIKELDQKWETLKDFMDEEECKVTEMKIKQEDKNSKVNDIINSFDAEKVFKESKQIRQSTKEAVKPVKLDFTTMPLFLSGEITESNFGSLQDVPKDLVLNIHHQFTTDIDGVGHLSTCSDNSFWISDRYLIQRVKPEAKNLKVMSNFTVRIFGMAVTPSNDLLLITHKTSRLKQISGSSGQVTDSVYSVDPLIIEAVHVTNDYKVIVGASASDSYTSVVIRMNKEGQHEKTYEHDRNTLLSTIFSITTTTNGTIFILDELDDICGQRVVVLGQDGDVLNTYKGHPKINSYDKPFYPACVVATPLDNIIVPDPFTSTLHILNSVGDIITYFDTFDIGILCPLSLTFTTSSQLYIGCMTLPRSTEKSKLYEIDISQI